MYFHLENTKKSCADKESKKNPVSRNIDGISKDKSGIVLLSHTVTHIVPSAPQGLTSLFGMGRGVTPAIKTPEFLKSN